MWAPFFIHQSSLNPHTAPDDALPERVHRQSGTVSHPPAVAARLWLELTHPIDATTTTVRCERISYRRDQLAFV